MRVLVLFASHHGQTHAIAVRIAELLRARGQRVHLRDIADEQPDPAHFDAVVVGAPVQLSKHDRRIGAWLARHARILARLPGAFFSVSMSAASTRPEVLAELDGIVTRFLAEAGWHPAHVVKLAGALHYTRYNWLVRQVMRLISGSQGRPTDTSRDYEFTDWAQVDRFVHDVLGLPAGTRDAPLPDQVNHEHGT
jgi:menaquinone-dependent protoporphyrinogen oxidase